MNSFYDAVSGVRTGKTVTFRNERGEDVELARPRDRRALRQVDSPAAREAAFMREVDRRHPFKVTFPAASIFPTRSRRSTGVRLGGRVRRARDRDRAGSGRRRDRVRSARYVQFDFPLYPYLVDPAWVGRFRRCGHDVGGARSTPRSPPTPPCSRGSRTTSPSACTSAAGTTARRGCARGRSSRSPSACSASSPYDAFLVEWDDRGRDGGFEPVRLPGRLGHGDGYRVDQDAGARGRGRPRCSAWSRRPASRAGMDRLAISPQCGFASVMVGNEIERGRAVAEARTGRPGRRPALGMNASPSG